MCGILAVKTKQPLPAHAHSAALDILSRRGPDFTVSQQVGNTFIAQTVLHITGTDEFYQQQRPDFFAYNGEIYNQKWFGHSNNDVELAYFAVKDRITRFRYFDGPWAWAYATGDSLLYAADPQGERCLYYYQDDDILVVSSEVAAILTYIKPVLQDLPYTNKGWSMISKTPWRDVFRCQPGRLYINGLPDLEIDSIWNWIKPNSVPAAQASEQFSMLWDQTCKRLTPDKPASVSYSGGVDSSLILQSIPNLQILTIDVEDKDPIAHDVEQFLSDSELARLNKIPTTPQSWGEEYLKIIDHTKLPVHWSHVGKWLVAKHAATPVIFTGLGADELFGGYTVYKNMTYSQSSSTSPYSCEDHEGIWQRCLDVYNGDPRPATLLMDYWYQIVGVDAPGLDRTGGAWGRETRNPFMSRPIMEFALNLPWELRQDKPLLRQRFLRRWPQQLMYPKQGFAGHANDSLPWIDADIIKTGDRQQDWKAIAHSSYYSYMRQSMS